MLQSFHDIKSPNLLATDCAVSWAMRQPIIKACEENGFERLCSPPIQPASREHLHGSGHFVRESPLPNGRNR
jgi:hypothetical protein